MPQNFKINSGLLVSAYGLGAFLALVSLASRPIISSLASSDTAENLVRVILVLLGSTAAIMETLASVLQRSLSRACAVIAALAVALEAAAQLLLSENLITGSTALLASVIGNAVFAAAATLLIAGLKPEIWLRRAAILGSGSVLSVGIFAVLTQSWIDLSVIANAVPLARDFGILIASSLVFHFCSSKSVSRQTVATLRSTFLRLRLKIKRPGIGIAQALLLTSLVNLGLAFFFLALGSELVTLESIWAALASTTFLLVFAFSDLRQTIWLQKQHQLTSRLAPSSAHRFLSRHSSKSSHWAATAGIKTTSFTIDHDPSGEIHSSLPASLLQIRSEEIQRCVDEVLGTMHLHSDVVGHRILGVIDPETAMRPCIDALKMFSCLYLDAGPLVERRIKALTALLPLVDPGLEEVYGGKNLPLLVRRSQWFFHVDYGWIDQHVIHTPRLTRYDVSTGAISSRLKHALLDHLSRTSQVGNAVWLGHEARDMLLQEAPFLRSVVEMSPVPTLDDAKELLMFRIKFENLIPRLQRSFALDAMRETLLDFEPSSESARVLNLLSLQVNSSKNVQELLDAMGALASIPWYGFREKDSALSLVITAYSKLKEFALDQVKMAKAKEKLAQTVSAIGYPSQALHSAQKRKLALRDTAKAREVALNVDHPRFTEAWLFVASHDFSKSPPSDGREILELIKTAGATPTLRRNRFVQVKSINALAGIAKANHAHAHELFDDLQYSLSNLYLWLAQEKADPDLCCLLLETDTFLHEHGIFLAPKSEAQGAFQDHLKWLQTQTKSTATEEALNLWRGLYQTQQAPGLRSA